MNDAQKALEQWLEITGVKEGDKVLVVDGAESWRASFGLKPVQDEFIGATGTVTHIQHTDEEGGIPNYVYLAVQAVNSTTKKRIMWHDMPFYALVKVEETENEPTNTD